MSLISLRYINPVKEGLDIPEFATIQNSLCDIST